MSEKKIPTAIQLAYDFKDFDSEISNYFEVLLSLSFRMGDIFEFPFGLFTEEFLRYEDLEIKGTKKPNLNESKKFYWLLHMMNVIVKRAHEDIQKIYGELSTTLDEHFKKSQRLHEKIKLYIVNKRVAPTQKRLKSDFTALVKDKNLTECQKLMEQLQELLTKANLVQEEFPNEIHTMYGLFAFADKFQWPFSVHLLCSDAIDLQVTTTKHLTDMSKLLTAHPNAVDTHQCVKAFVAILTTNNEVLTFLSDSVLFNIDAEECTALLNKINTAESKSLEKGINEYSDSINKLKIQMTSSSRQFYSNTDYKESILSHIDKNGNLPNANEIKAILNCVKDDTAKQWNAFKANNTLEKMSESINNKLGDFMWQIYSFDEHHHSKPNLLEDICEDIGVIKSNALSSDTKQAIQQVNTFFESYTKAQIGVLQKIERILGSPPSSPTAKPKKS